MSSARPLRHHNRDLRCQGRCVGDGGAGEGSGFVSADGREGAEERASRTGRGPLIYQDNAGTDSVSHHPRSNKWALTYLVRTIRVRSRPPDRIGYPVSHMSTQGHYPSLLNRRHIPFRGTIPRAPCRERHDADKAYIFGRSHSDLSFPIRCRRAPFVSCKREQGISIRRSRKILSLLNERNKLWVEAGCRMQQDRWAIRSGENRRTFVQKSNKRATLHRGSPGILPRPDFPDAHPSMRV